jgi:hypothetical protein
MDGRTQKPVIEYLSDRFGADYVDMITEPGPNRILSDGQPEAQVSSILHRVSISVEKHGSKVIAVVGHHDCAGNPSAPEEQSDQCRRAAQILKNQFPDARILALWIDARWAVHEIS